MKSRTRQSTIAALSRVYHGRLPVVVALALAFVAVGASSAKAQQAPAVEQFETLRGEGPAKFFELYSQYQASLNRCRSAPLTAADKQAWEDALDAIGGARLSSRSGLYWYTDWEQAVAAAQSEGKPILTLRLLGKLTDDLSCANSRFFRTLLYPDPKIADVLRERFVLHWKSVRPVPQVTIDFGDGRVICTTLTGNSIHYVTTSDGELVDALPGLTGPEWFANWLSDAHSLATGLTELVSASDRRMVLTQHHLTRLNQTVKQWQQSLATIQGTDPQTARSTAGKKTNAAAASRLAVTKRVMVEVPLLADVYRDLELVESRTDEQNWSALSQPFAPFCQLSPAARNVIREQTYQGLIDSEESSLEDVVEQRVAKLESTLAWDTAYNEYLLRGKVRKMIIDGDYGNSVDGLNERVYDTVFMTPHHDRWLGLLPADRYIALENDGVSSDDRG